MVFYGASGHGKVVIEAWVAQGGLVESVIDDNGDITALLGFQVHSPKNIDTEYKNMIISIGANNIRRRIVESHQFGFGKVMHPTSTISLSSFLGEGSVILAGAIVNAEVNIGKHCIINTAAAVDHDCKIGDYVHIAPNVTLCGGVRIGNGTLVGAGSTIIPEIKIGVGCIIGAGSVVIKDVQDYSCVVGNPAKKIKDMHG